MTSAHVVELDALGKVPARLAFEAESFAATRIAFRSGTSSLGVAANGWSTVLRPFGRPATPLARGRTPSASRLNSFGTMLSPQPMPSRVATDENGLPSTCWHPHETGRREVSTRWRRGPTVRIMAQRTRSGAPLTAVAYIRVSKDEQRLGAVVRRVRPATFGRQIVGSFGFYATPLARRSTWGAGGLRDETEPK